GSVLKTSSGTSKKNSKAGANKALNTNSKDRMVFSFGAGQADGNEDQKELLGGKGANLHGMTKLGLPVPPGFTITTEVCTHFYKNGKSYPKRLEAQAKAALAKMKKIMGRKFGGAKSPLHVSVRSGARASM